MSIRCRIVATVVAVSILVVACVPSPAMDLVPTNIPVPARAATSSPPTPAADPTPAQGSPASLEPSDVPISPSSAADVKPLYALSGHNPSVAGLAFLPDGQGLASVSKDLALRVWDLASGQEIDGPLENGERIYNVAFSPDGTLLATGGADNTIRLWDVKTGERVRTLSRHDADLLCLEFSPDSSLLATGSSDQTVKLWDVASGRQMRTLDGHITPVTALAFSPDGTMLASGSARFSTTIILWDLARGKQLDILVGHSDNVHSLAFSPDGTLLASASLDRTVKVWDVQTGRLLYTFTGQGVPAYGLAFSPDSSLLAASSDKGSIKLWDMQSGQELNTLVGHNDQVRSLAFSPDGTLLASGGLDDSVLLWGITRGEGYTTRLGSSEKIPTDAALVLPAPGKGQFTGLNDGVVAFSSYRQGEAKIYTMNADGSNITCLTRSNLRDTRPAWSPDGTRIAYVRRISHSNHEIYVMNADGTDPVRLTINPDFVESQPTWSPDGTQIAFISNRNLNVNTFSGRFNIFIMSVPGGSNTVSSGETLLTDIGGSNTSPDWSPDGARIAFDSTRDGDYEIYVINVDGSHPVNLTLHPANDTSPTWSPDGSKIAFVSDRDGNEEIYVMNADGSNPTRLTFREGYDKAPAWSPDGRYIVFYASPEAHNTEVYRMRSDGSEQVRLTDHADFDGFPVWQPYAVAPETLAIQEPSQVEATAPSPSESSVTTMMASLQGLSLDEFLDESFKLLLLRDPEWVTSEGLAQRFGVGNDQLTDISDAHLRETQQLQAAILDMLRQYDRESLTPEQQISYDVYEWYLDDLVRGQEFMYYDYPVTHFTTGVQYQLIQFFTDLHPIASHQDAEGYVKCLHQVDEKFDGLIEGLRLREEAGIIIPQFIFPWFMHDIHTLAHDQPRYTPFYTTFENKLADLEELSSEDKQALLAAAEEAIEDSVIPGFANLENTLQHLQPLAPTDAGVWQFPNGDAYYGYILHHHTTTDLTPDEIHELGLGELDRVHTEMRAIADELGYPQDISIPDLYRRVARESGSVSGRQVAETYEAIIKEAEQRLDTAFDIRPKADVVVIAGPQGDYYVSASLDGSRPGAFYARTDGGSTEQFGMPTLAYHEAVPGHHFQIAIAQESDLPLFRNVILFTGYAEGWALYAEQLAYELGWYEDDPHGNLGRLQAQAFRAARLVVDTGIHTQGWTFDQAHDFMIQNTGLDPGYLQFEVSRYITWPGQATAYMVGMLKIMELRQKAIDQLGAQFDLKEFHRVVLSNGSMPLEVLEQVVDNYIEDKLNQ
jgi:uncharacterized protein (DUF885 family)/WD40 repeat protein